MSVYVLVSLDSLQGHGKGLIYKSIGIPTVSALLKEKMSISPPEPFAPYRSLSEAGGTSMTGH